MDSEDQVGKICPRGQKIPSVHKRWQVLGMGARWSRRRGTETHEWRSRWKGVGDNPCGKTGGIGVAGLRGDFINVGGREEETPVREQQDKRKIEERKP
jgi:hypothetical protein